MTEEIIEKYKRKLDAILFKNNDNEDAHCRYDGLLESLIKELGYGEILDYAERLIDGNDIDFWYA